MDFFLFMMCFLIFAGLGALMTIGMDSMIRRVKVDEIRMLIKDWYKDLIKKLIKKLNQTKD